MSRWAAWYEQVTIVCRQKEDELRAKAKAFSVSGEQAKVRALEQLIQRLGEASRMVLDGYVSYQGQGVFSVRSRSQDKLYTTRRGACDCPASRFKIQCTHRLAAYLYYEGTLRFHRLFVNAWLARLKELHLRQEVIESQLLSLGYEATGAESS